MLLSVENVTFRYPKAASDALRGVSLSVSDGQWAVLCGLSGCGKSTLLRLIKRELAPFGQMSGRILFDGKNTFNAARTQTSDDEHAREAMLSDREAATGIGIVLQDPESQIVTDEVWHELAFGPENLGLPSDTIRRRVAEMASFFGIEGWYHRKTYELSGGQKQLLNLASALVMNPRLLLLDEPTAQLDPIAATEFRNMLTRINRDLGVTILMAEHRLENVMPLADRIFLMDRLAVATADTTDGTPAGTATDTVSGTTADKAADTANGTTDSAISSVITAGTPAEVAQYLYAHSHPMAEALPAATRVYFAITGRSAGLGETTPAGDTAIPFTVRDGRNFLATQPAQTGGTLQAGSEITADTDNAATKTATGTNSDFSDAQVALEARDLRFRYAKQSPDVLSEASIALHAGEHYCLLGGNGSGKTTMLSLLAGLTKPYAGSVRLFGRKMTSFGPGELYRNNLALLPQQPRDVFVEKTIREDLEKAFERMDGAARGKNTPAGTNPATMDSVATSSATSPAAASSATANISDTAMAQLCERLRITDILDSHPYDVSGGELQKAALAKVLASRPKVLLLDEPTKGIDVRGKRELAGLLDELRSEGLAVLTVTHDAEWAAEHADRCGLLFDGEVISEGDPKTFFEDNAFYTTAANRMVRGIVDGAITVSDVARAYGCAAEVSP